MRCIEYYPNNNKTIDGKHYEFDDYAENRRCEDCKGPIKARMVKIKKRKPVKCYRCWCTANGKLSGQERRKLRKKNPLIALAEEAQNSGKKRKRK